MSDSLSGKTAGVKMVGNQNKQKRMHLASVSRRPAFSTAVVLAKRVLCRGLTSLQRSVIMFATVTGKVSRCFRAAS